VSVAVTNAVGDAGRLSRWNACSAAVATESSQRASSATHSSSRPCRSIAARPAVADGRALRPADERDPAVPALHQVVDDRADPGHVVDVEPWVRVGAVLGPAEGDERDAQAEQRGGAGIVGHDVVEHERVGRSAAMQPLRGGDLGRRVACGVDEEVPVGLASGLGERMQEPVVDRGQRAGDQRFDPVADGPRGVEAQRLGRAVGLVSQLGDEPLDTLAGLGADAVGRVDDVRHGLAGHARGPRDVARRGRTRGRCVPVCLACQWTLLVRREFRLRNSAPWCDHRGRCYGRLSIFARANAEAL